MSSYGFCLSLVERYGDGWKVDKSLLIGELSLDDAGKVSSSISPKLTAQKRVRDACRQTESGPNLPLTSDLLVSRKKYLRFTVTDGDEVVRTYLPYFHKACDRITDVVSILSGNLRDYHRQQLG